MTGRPAYIVADNIISPLGTGSSENYRRVLSGESALRLHSGAGIGVSEDYQASLMDEESDGTGMIPGDYTLFEKRLILSVSKALYKAGWIEPSSDRVLFIVSSTKGNIGGLLGESARKVARFFGNKVSPLVVSNACISGLCAQIEAMRALSSGRFDHVVVCGSDIQSKFIVSGFQSFKALSQQPCRPFDSSRDGLNLGEAAATMVYSSVLPDEAYASAPGGKIWIAERGAIRNDANHISGPSRTGEGSYRALKAALGDFPASDLAFVNPHGTATLYNDEMESIAITRAGLGSVPVAGYKGYYGHTMGAAGLIETIISMRAVENHMIPGTRGYNQNGVSCPLDISSSPRPTDKDSFVKLLSGFGGCNAAVLFTLADAHSVAGSQSAPVATAQPSLEYLHRVHISPDGVELDGEPLEAGGKGEELLTDIYRRCVGDYPKFYKMDPLCRLGFVASELLTSAEGKSPEGREDRAVILFNRSASLADDRIYLDTVSGPDNYFPSPKVFVYTLPNIVTGEIAIRNKYYGETSFHVLDERDDEVIENVIMQALAEPGTESVLGGWCECSSPDDFEADMFICKAL